MSPFHCSTTADCVDTMGGCHCSTGAQAGILPLYGDIMRCSPESPKWNGLMLMRVMCTSLYVCDTSQWIAQKLAGSFLYFTKVLNSMRAGTSVPVIGMLYAVVLCAACIGGTFYPGAILDVQAV